MTFPDPNFLRDKFILLRCDLHSDVGSAVGRDVCRYLTRVSYGTSGKSKEQNEKNPNNLRLKHEIQPVG